MENALAQILARLDAIEEHTQRMEQRQQQELEDLRGRIERKDSELARLTEQTLRMVELLHEARQQISRMEHSGGS